MTTTTRAVSLPQPQRRPVQVALSGQRGARDERRPQSHADAGIYLGEYLGDYLGE